MKILHPSPTTVGLYDFRGIQIGQGSRDNRLATSISGLRVETGLRITCRIEPWGQVGQMNDLHRDWEASNRYSLKFFICPVS